jgi:voltage-gated potassium channel Kch
VQSVLGAVCIYLVIGMLYASVDSGLSQLTGQPFFAGAPKVSSSQYTYFSFITLTTVGYGDLTPGPGAARALAVVEALTGQLYLVTVIALIVGNFGRAREPRPGTGAR